MRMSFLYSQIDDYFNEKHVKENVNKELNNKIQLQFEEITVVKLLKPCMFLNIESITNYFQMLINCTYQVIRTLNFKNLD